MNMNPYRRSMESLQTYFNAISTYFKKLSMFSINLMGLVCVAFIGELDYLTGYEVDLIVFYLIPISIVTWFAGKKSGILISIVSAIAIYTTNILSGKMFSSPVIFFWDASITLLVFAVVVSALSALENSLGRYKTLIETAPDPILVYSLNGNILAANAQAAQIYGVSSVAELLSEVKTIFDLLSEEGKAFAKNNFRRTIMEGYSRKNEYSICVHDGKFISVDVNSSVIRTITGEPQAFISVIRDITDRKQAEEALRKSEDKYRTLIETTGTGFVIIDQDGVVLDANSEYVRLTGNSDLSEIVGRNVIEWTADCEKEKNAAAVKACFDQGYIRNFEIDYVDSRGKITPIEVNATCLKIEGETNIITICRDITDRKRAAEALIKSEDKFRKAFYTNGTCEYKPLFRWYVCFN